MPDQPSRWAALRAAWREYSTGPYRRAVARAARDEDDLLRMLVLSEALGVPDPARYYTIELLPVLYEEVHEWHRRMGLERSPVEAVTCC